MAVPRIGGAGFGLNLNGAFASQLPLLNVGQTASAAQFTAGAVQASNVVTLNGGSCYLLPAGTFYVQPGACTSLQFLDPVTGIWRTVNATPFAGGFNVACDGGNVRLANLTGTPIGALITNAGTGYTNGIGTAATGLTITPSAGGSVWVPVVGGVNNATVTITAGGANYSFPPLLVCSPPPFGGVQMTAVVGTMSGGAITGVTVLNQGAGYTAPATITVINDYRDITGGGAVLTAGALVQSGGLAAMYPAGAVNAAFAANVGGQGIAVSAVPTFTFAPASTTAATCLCCFAATGLTVTGGGTAVPAGSMLQLQGGAPTGTRASNVAGPIADFNLMWPRAGWIQPNISGGVIQGTGNIVLDPGLFYGVPSALTVSSTGVAPTGGTNLTVTVGGVTDLSWVQPF